MENTRTKFLTVPVFVAAMGVSPAIHAAETKQSADHKADKAQAAAKAPDWLKTATGRARLTEAA